ncbi:MAG: adenylyltransferase/cytidyltransferase family protein [Lentisphaerae bacterium]|nr:adenylyltransferase/cytidyltransferase family protein [Lentisphaerota bacterium]
MSSSKIVDLKELAQVLARRRAESALKVAHCHGVFDLLHIGHIKHLEEARAQADVLVVTITPDRFVNKGPGRPVFTEQLRLEALAALECVTYVALNLTPTAVEPIALLKPDVYVKGGDYRCAEDDITGKITDERLAVESGGGRIHFTDGVVFSSSALINSHFAPPSEDLARFLRTFKASFGFADILKYISGCRPLRVLMLGETIIDEYQFCSTMGKSGKEPILAAQYLSTEKSIGGVLAAANHAAAFCDQVQLLTELGSVDSQESFIRERLDARIHPHFVHLAGAPTMIKRRFVEQYPFQKLFEIYVMDDRLPRAHVAELCQELERLLPLVDLVIVTDYGHGMLERELIDLLCERAPYLAVNTQKNAGNHGFNTVSKYRRADFVSISEAELRLDARNRSDSVEALMKQVTDQLMCRHMVVTQGGQGCLSFDRRDGIVHVPALTQQFKDRVGAGDALFAVASMCACQGAPASIVGLVGNAVGAQAVGVIANRESVNRETVSKHLMHLLK